MKRNYKLCWARGSGWFRLSWGRTELQINYWRPDWMKAAPVVDLRWDVPSQSYCQWLEDAG